MYSRGQRGHLMNDNWTKDTSLQYVIEEAFTGDFTGLKERNVLDNCTLQMLKKLQESYFLQFEATVKAHIAMAKKEE